MEKQTVTIYDVAREAEVSMATVSRVVNGNSNVRPATRERVLAVIKELDYRPNAVARGLASKKTTTVGVIIPNVTNLFFSSLALGIDDVASMYDYNIILANADSKDPQKVLTSILSKQVDGIVYMGHYLPDQVRDEMERRLTPFVLAGLSDDQSDIASVNIDYTAAFKEMVGRMIDKGAKKVAFLAAEPYFDNNTDRFDGYKQALEEAGIALDENLLFKVEDTRFKNGDDVAKDILASDADALAVVGDELAVTVSNYLIDNGVKIPEDFQVVSSNNSPLVDLVRPHLSSIKPPLYDIGAVSMRILTKLMGKADDDEEIENKVTLDYQINEQGSTK
ncbi:substrate-binding domain-containing protein [Aerococcus kribbianus]|uniref:Substrate-binding domain-containing protein n=1 Tax=Aerococcus kribbianus TaxID=2999064 RepID=A0A9X3JGA6_9LACT|nr:MULTISPECIES: substrate-binding domain-containing protein [unclassified Aerococcus]MCZ0717036.1 substrate-binding domain-containing protein [Aerococcus sp. YH-aer221]MCZ0725324.1 substrate-binding domain-containing protein [Aerococcus sp. YH-aer222]